MTRHRVSSSSSSVAPAGRPPAARALLLARHTPDQTSEDVASSLSELALLVEGLGMSVAGKVVQRRSSEATALGKGKRQEVATLLADMRAGPGPVAVVFDGSLDPGARRLLENEIDAEVLDRTEIILRVFAARARTRVAQLEVEAAQLRYQTPRLRDEDEGDDREGGGGRGERGHTNVVLRKRRLAERLARIERELALLRPLHDRQRDRRSHLPSVALVGYTNAGKSSLMRGLTGSEVLVRDQLFATLGTTVRALSPATTPRILVTDTVGFIKNLPHALVDSFRSTLDEARDADLLLYVVDAADPQWRDQLQVTRQTIAALGDGTPPSLVVLNKIDRVPEARRRELAAELPAALQTNAHDRTDQQRLRANLLAHFDAQMREQTLSVPVADGRLLAQIRAEARVLEESCDEQGQRMVVRLRAMPDALERWRQHG